MDKELKEEKRSIIPRWRDFETTRQLGELRSSANEKPKKNTSKSLDLDELTSDWLENQTLSFATDLIGASFASGRYEDIEGAAKFILSTDVNATDLQKRIATQVTNGGYFSDHLQSEHLDQSSEELIPRSKEKIRLYRHELRDSLRNPIKLVELSREHVTLGNTDKALRAMEIAVALAPTNRFVLRCAVRLYVHVNEIERAHYLLLRSPSLRKDAWLLAAEIAVASKLGRTSPHMKFGIRKIQDTNYGAFELSELTSAIATNEIKNSNIKRARKLFRLALKAPTENSIAQVEWASRTEGNLNFEISSYQAPRNFEALAWNHYAQGAFSSAIGLGKSWILDQPFAITPVIFTAMISLLLEDFELSKKILKFGVQANPRNFVLRNNLAFALASNNEPDEAIIQLAQIDRTTINHDEHIILAATEGLINFRKGNVDVGRKLYETAIETAGKSENTAGYGLRALMYLCREEINAKSNNAIAIMIRLEKEAKKYRPTKEMAIMLDRLSSKIMKDKSN